MKTILEIKNIHDVAVMVRAALNVEVEDGKVINSFRLRRALPTIKYLQERNARVVLIGHISDTGTETLFPVFEELQKYLRGVVWCPVHKGAEAKKMIDELLPGQVIVLDNLRRDKREQENDSEFAQELASLADIFVQDSFDVCHRKHASVVGVPKILPSYAGLLVVEELKELTKALKPKRPSLAIIGGAKFSTKEPVLKKLLKVYDRVFVGGALANDFIKAMGYPVGVSLTSNADMGSVKKLLSDKKLALPLDAIVAGTGQNRTLGRVTDLRGVQENESILDSGPETSKYLEQLITKSKTVLWNGPLGNYEDGFVDGSEALAQTIAQSKTVSVLGGGDTVALVEKANLGNSFTFVSTGGGAMLDFIANGTLPGIEALN